MGMTLKQIKRSCCNLRLKSGNTITCTQNSLTHESHTDELVSLCIKLLSSFNCWSSDATADVVVVVVVSANGA